MFKLFNVFTIFLLCSGVESYFYNDFNFVTQMYNTSDCSNSSFRNISFTHRCQDNQITNGYPGCFKRFLKSINIFHN